jgi:hypothetical protein
MSEKSFSIENLDKNQNYKDKLLAIINDAEKKARLIRPNDALHKETHTERVLSNKNEAKEHEEIRKDICESFGVELDGSHVFVLDSGGGSIKKQRAERASAVLIDAYTREAFYGEGRTGHIVLLNEMIALAHEVAPDVTPDVVFSGLETDPPQFLYFKGFLSDDGFPSLSDGAKSTLKTAIFDANGDVIETPAEWFLTGHSLEGHSPTKIER